MKIHIILYLLAIVLMYLATLIQTKPVLLVHGGLANFFHR